MEIVGMIVIFGFFSVYLLTNKMSIFKKFYLKYLFNHANIHKIF